MFIVHTHILHRTRSNCHARNFLVLKNALRTTKIKLCLPFYHLPSLDVRSMWDKFLDQRLSCHAWFGTSSHDPVVQVAVRSRPDSRWARASNLELWHPFFHHLDRHLDRHSAKMKKKKIKTNALPKWNIINIYKWRTDTDLLLLMRCIFQISSWIKNCWCDLLNITHISNIPSD